MMDYDEISKGGGGCLMWDIFLGEVIFGVIFHTVLVILAVFGTGSLKVFVDHYFPSYANLFGEQVREENGSMYRVIFFFESIFFMSILWPLVVKEAILIAWGDRKMMNNQ